MFWFIVGQWLGHHRAVSARYPGRRVTPARRLGALIAAMFWIVIAVSMFVAIVHG